MIGFCINSRKKKCLLQNFFLKKRQYHAFSIDIATQQNQNGIDLKNYNVEKNNTECNL